VHCEKVLDRPCRPGAWCSLLGRTERTGTGQEAHGSEVRFAGRSLRGWVRSSTGRGVWRRHRRHRLRARETEPASRTRRHGLRAEEQGEGSRSQRSGLRVEAKGSDPIPAQRPLGRGEGIGFRTRSSGLRAWVEREEAPASAAGTSGCGRRESAWHRRRHLRVEGHGRRNRSAPRSWRAQARRLLGATTVFGVIVPLLPAHRPSDRSRSAPSQPTGAGTRAVPPVRGSE
jgi:hypothetical protein